ncbi:hypothetical protein OKW96_04535 [Sphingobacterium sp. KU25419]|nr:hypothetical protein OKW96_04535 [Sphingobacterium sp. KU25419]
MSKEVKTIKGGVANDLRGQIRFVNDFDMSLIKRFYIIKNADTELIRGWRGHQIEQRWFYVLKGTFEMDLIQIDNWTSPSKTLTIEHLEIKDKDLIILHIPAGYATAFRAVEEGSELMVFADYDLSHAASDDHTWPMDYFINGSYFLNK